MPMRPFIERFPDLGARETRSVTVTDQPGLPNGEYGFLELYCDEPGCDCRRVTIVVLRPETGWGTTWATIGYGWESPDFYRKWSKAGSDPIEMKGPALDSFNAQTSFAPALLKMFRSLIQSPDYVERLKRHYQMFRGPVESETKRVENRRKRLRDPQRRRRHPH
jgi:hypothetical protein